MATKESKHPCKFWSPQKRSGCKFGDECRYLHALPKPYKCRYFFSSSGCRSGDHCVYLHAEDDSSRTEGSSGKDKSRLDEEKKSKSGHLEREQSKSRGRLEEENRSKKKAMNEKVKGQIVELFKLYDTNSDGVIANHELAQVLQLLNPAFTAEEVDRLMHAVDTNGDGLIQYEEFVSFCGASGDEWDKTRKFLRAGEEGDSLDVSVSDFAGPQYDLKAKSGWTVARLKLAIFHLSGIPPPFQDLSAGGEDVDDQESLGGSKIKALTEGFYEFQLMDSRTISGGSGGGGGDAIVVSALVAPADPAPSPVAKGDEEFSLDLF